MPKTELEKLATSIAKTSEAMKSQSTPKLRENVEKMKGHAKTASHTLERMVWRDLIKITKAELKRREKEESKQEIPSVTSPEATWLTQDRRPTG